MILHQMTRQTTFGSSPAFGAHPFQRLPLRPDASGTVLMLRATSTFLFSCYVVILSLYESIVNPGSSKHRQNLPPPRILRHFRFQKCLPLNINQTHSHSHVRPGPPAPPDALEAPVRSESHRLHPDTLKSP